MFLHKDLTFALNGVVFKVYNEIRRFAKEKQYYDLFKKCLVAEELNYKRELVVGDTGNQVDFLIQDRVLVEMKAKVLITKDDYNQVQRY